MSDQHGAHMRSFVFSESEWEWIERRAEEIYLKTGEPLPFAKTAAIADLVRLRQRPKAKVIEFRASAPGTRRSGSE